RAPAAADVEESLFRPQTKLAADHVELVALRGRKVVRPVFEIGAAVDDLGIEKERVECVGNVVMVLDVLLVGGFGAIGGCPVAANGRERPWTAARNEHELRSGCQRQALVQPFDDVPATHRGSAGREIEQGSVADVDPPRDPEIEKRVYVRP